MIELTKLLAKTLTKISKFLICEDIMKLTEYTSGMNVEVLREKFATHHAVYIVEWIKI